MVNKIYTIIPARGGSKRIPQKNKKLFCGKPLVCWTIEEALRTPIFRNIYLSSDDEDILKIGEKYDGIDIHWREEHASTDKASAFDVIKDVINRYDLKDNDVIVYLQPTSPLRVSEHIREAFYMLMKANFLNSTLISGVFSPMVHYGFLIDKFGIMKPLISELYFNTRTQKLPKTYIPNGAIYIASVKNLLDYKSFYTLHTLIYIMHKSESVDIDDQHDWDYAEFLMNKRLKNE